MRKLLALSLVSVTFATPALARDTVYKIKLAEVLSMPEAKSKLDGSVKFYLAGAKTPRVIELRGSDVTNQKTSSIGKTDEFGCKWAALSALIALQESAKRQGANAVVDLVSFYKKQEFKSAREFECHAGSVIVGVALKGNYARVDR